MDLPPRWPDGKSPLRLTLWDEHRGALLADWRQWYQAHPWEPSIPAEEAELLTEQLLSDPRSRCHARVGGYPAPVELWLQMHLTSTVASALGSPLELPTAPGKRARARSSAPREVVDRARGLLEQHSAITGLEEI